jgi:hypothetical protein
VTQAEEATVAANVDVGTWESRLRAQMPASLPPPGASYRDTYPEFVLAVVEACRKHGINPVSKATGLKYSTIHRWVVTHGIGVAKRGRPRLSEAAKKAAKKGASTSKAPVRKVGKVLEFPPQSPRPAGFVAGGEDREISAMMVISAALNSLPPDGRRAVAVWLGMKISSILSA